MSFEKVQTYLIKQGYADRINVFFESCATCELAAAALGVDVGRIVKTMVIRDGSGEEGEAGCMMVLLSGDTKLDRKRFKERFGFKAVFCDADEVLAKTGQQVGGVCPFDVPDDIPIYLDEALRRFESVYPSCGSENTMAEFSPAELEQITGATGWVAVSKSR